MIVFRQAARPTDRTPHVLADSVVEPEYPVCLWVVDPEIGAPTMQVIQITKFEGKTLVAVPFAVWHRGVSKRVLPGTALVKPTRRTQTTAPRLWRTSQSSYGLASSDTTMSSSWNWWRKQITSSTSSTATTFSCPFGSGACGSGPRAFRVLFNWRCGWRAADRPRARGARSSCRARCWFPSQPPHGQGREHSGRDLSRAQEAGWWACENGAEEEAKGEGNFVRQPQGPGGRTSQQIDVKSKYPMLDPGVVQAALQAGIPEANLAQMQQVVRSNGKRSKLGFNLHP